MYVVKAFETVPPLRFEQFLPQSSNMYLNLRTTGLQRVAAFHSLASQRGGGRVTASQSMIGSSRARIAS
jgi:hypothetical protein